MCWPFPFPPRLLRGFRPRNAPGIRGAVAVIVLAAPIALVKADPAVPELSDPRAELIPIERVESGPTPMSSMSDWKVGNFHVPAPRSVILSSDGVPLATNRVAHRLVCNLSKNAKSGAEAVARVRRLEEEFSPGFPLLQISDVEIERHFEHRSWIPLPVSNRLPESSMCGLEEVLPDDCRLDAFYERHYPEGELTAHLIGYTGVSLPDQHGPLGKVEFTFPPTEGRAGMEKSLDETFRGRDAEYMQVVDERGAVRHQEPVREAQPGEAHVLTIHMGMQRLAREQLERTGRPGAFVAIDADTGDILALVSYPSFDPNLFLGGISKTDYAALTADPDAPLFDRAVTGAYPPGSTFKPIVALAGMDAGVIMGTATRFSGPAGMTIDGRYFKNHSSVELGPMDVRYALVKSCNTWFYQAGLEMGAAPIAGLSRRFGFGHAPDLPLPSVAAGNIPEPALYGDPRSLANFSIGQGEVLVSPVQLALAMGGLANGSYVPRARLVREVLDPYSGKIRKQNDPAVLNYLNVRQDDLDLVRDGMWGVVNHGSGTATGASMANPVVYGKTGTSQWSSGGKMRYLAWFSGWVDAQQPRIAFAAVTQGEEGEILSGGRSASPIAAGFLRTVYKEPDLYAVTLPAGPSRDVSSIVAAEVIPPLPETLVIDDRFRRRGPGSLLRALFGGGRRPVRTLPPEAMPRDPFR